MLRSSPLKTTTSRRWRCTSLGVASGLGAAALFERSVHVRENDGMIDNVGLAESLERLASAYEALGRSDEAAPLFARSLEIREQVYGSEDPSLAKSLNGLGLIQYANGNYREAEELFERALDITERDDGLDDLFALSLIHI